MVDSGLRGDAGGGLEAAAASQRQEHPQCESRRAEERGQLVFGDRDTRGEKLALTLQARQP